MKNSNKKKLLSFILVVIFVFFFSFSIGFVIKSAHHDCSQTHCVVCLQIESNVANLKLLSHSDLSAVIISCYCMIVILIYSTKPLYYKRKDLVFLKVRMDN